MMWGSENVDKVYSGFCGADIVVSLVAADLSAAALALVGVVAGVGPAYTDLGLEVPVFAEEPGVAVGHANAGIPALVAVVLEETKVIVEKFESVTEMAHIVLATKEMYSEEVTSEGLAEPIARLGLHHPVFPFLAAGESPGIVISRQIYTPPGSDLHLGSDIYSQSRIIKEIGFYG